METVVLVADASNEIRNSFQRFFSLWTFFFWGIGMNFASLYFCGFLCTHTHTNKFSSHQKKMSKKNVACTSLLVALLYIVTLQLALLVAQTVFSIQALIVGRPLYESSSEETNCSRVLMIGFIIRYVTGVIVIRFQLERRFRESIRAVHVLSAMSSAAVTTTPEEIRRDETQFIVASNDYARFFSSK